MKVACQTSYMNILHRSTLKAVISKCYDAAFYENILLWCEYDHQVWMIT